VKNLKTNKKALRLSSLYSGISIALLSVISTPLLAQDAQKNAEEEVEKIVVTGSPVFRNRTSSVSPQLEYGGLFFEQFEPTSVGDMLKRTPGVSFSSDVGEYDAPQMRGLGEGYTQVLINGKKVPGSGSDRAVLVDRIPAEMVDRIQVIRSPSADQDSQGVGGTINIILKDGASFDGGSVKVGALRADDGTVRGNGSFGYGANTNDMSWTLSANFQQRYVSKTKIEQTFEPDGDLESGFVPGDMTSDQLEIDTRDSDDISLSAGISYDLSSTSVLDLQANYLNTDRTEMQTEDTVEFDDEGDEWEYARDDVFIDEESVNISAVYSKDLDNSNFELSASFSNTTDVEDITKFERADPEDMWEYDAKEYEDTEDTEILLGGFFETVFDNEIEFKAGLDASMKDRDETIIEYNVDGETGEIEDIDLEQTYDAQEDRFDGYFMGSKEIFDGASLELGLRVEHTSRTITAEGVSFDSSSTQINPSAHFSAELNDTNTLRMSLAQTVKRPNFKQLAPITQIDEPEDGDAKQGNPYLEDEVSLGFDVGYEHTFGQGIIGFNVFYRDITDVIEEGAIGVTEDGGTLYSYNNAGDGSVWGLEMDFSTPLGDDTGFFANLTLLDSAIDDQFTGEERRFRDQSDYIYNLGVTHNFPEWETSVGFSYQKQGDSLSVDFNRRVELSYGANLEVFVEKRFGEGYVLRLSGTNLLDAHKIEKFTKFDGDSAQEIIDNHILGDVDEFEREDESAGPMVTLTLRKSF